MLPSPAWCRSVVNSPNPTPAKTARRAPPVVRARRLVAGPRDEDDREDREGDPHALERTGQPLRDGAREDRDRGAEDAGDRRDDPHPADREGAIEGDEADDAARARDRSPREAPGGRQGLAAGRARATSTTTSPSDCPTSTTRSAGARRDANPPEKSAVPHVAAEARPRATVARVEPIRPTPRPRRAARPVGRGRRRGRARGRLVPRGVAARPGRERWARRARSRHPRARRIGRTS